MILECRGVSCAFGRVASLTDVQVAVQHNEFVGLVGPNGAGKTTLLNVICGLVAPNAGSVIFNDVDIAGWAFDRRAKAGIIRSFEDGGVWSRLSVLDNVALGAYASPMSLSAARTAATHYLRALGLGDAISSDAEHLSLGQKRRMELARALLRYDTIGRRSLMILDEPSRGLDHEGKRTLVELLQRHIVGRCSVLMVEHDIELAKEICSRLVGLKAGHLAEPALDGSGEQDLPAHPEMGSPSTTEALRAENIRAGYGGEDVLRGVSFSIRHGEAVQVRGTNGSGKSTLLKVIVGSLKQSAGRIQLSGVELETRENRLKRAVGYAPQGGRLIRGLSVSAHLELAKAARSSHSKGFPADPDFVRAFPELRNLLLSSAGSLSSGQRSLVALWTALATGPTLLLADEPAAGLAPDVRHRVYEFLRVKWLRPDRALLFVEHGEPQPWARTLTLDRGVLVAQ